MQKSRPKLSQMGQLGTGNGVLMLIEATIIVSTLGRKINYANEKQPFYSIIDNFKHPYLE